MHDPDPMEYVALDAELRGVNASVGAAEAHGLICALLCVPNAIERLSWLEEVLPAAGETETSPGEAKRTLLDVAHQSETKLASREFEFYPLLPDDEFPIQSRSAALGEWCAGFLFGMSIAGAGDLQALPEDSREVLTDFSKFATIRSSTATEDEEGAYAELVEYIRVGVMLIYQELGEHSETETDPTRH